MLPYVVAAVVALEDCFVVVGGACGAVLFADTVVLAVVLAVVRAVHAGLAIDNFEQQLQFAFVP